MAARKHPIPKDLKKEEVLALDIATACGYHTHNGGGTWNFSESKTRNGNKKHKHFRDTLIKYITENSIRMVVAEDVLMNKKRFRATISLAEMRGVLLEVCDELGLPEPEFLNATNIKTFATAKGNASKDDMEAACKKRYNIDPVDDNHADAVFILYLFCRKFKVN